VHGAGGLLNSLRWTSSGVRFETLLVPSFAAVRGCNVRFCPQCGAPIRAAARFCVECGVRLDALGGASTASASTPPHASSGAESGLVPPPPSTLAPFMATFSAIVGVGILVAYGVMRQIPQREALLLPASQPASPVQDAQQLPPGHPTIQLPKEARDFISAIARKAEANPRDIAT